MTTASTVRHLKLAPPVSRRRPTELVFRGVRIIGYLVVWLLALAWAAPWCLLGLVLLFTGIAFWIGLGLIALGVTPVSWLVAHRVARRIGRQLEMQPQGQIGARGDTANSATEVVTLGPR